MRSVIGGLGQHVDRSRQQDDGASLARDQTRQCKPQPFRGAGNDGGGRERGDRRHGRWIGRRPTANPQVANFQ